MHTISLHLVLHAFEGNIDVMGVKL
jgi:hypothetical protein